MGRFEVATATRIVFGPGTAAECGEMARPLGRRALVVTGSQSERARPVLDSLVRAGLGVETFPVPGEPTTIHVASGVARARLKGHDVVIGVGGGSAIDAAKAIAGLLTNEGDLFDYLEIVGRGQQLPRPAVPWIAIPTTAGAGAEVTRNAVLTSREHKVKASLRSPFLLARIAIVDPYLTLNLPPAVTAATGLDALTQLIEPFLCNRANPFVDSLCHNGIPRVARSLRTAVRDGTDLGARGEMALGALYGGLALANAGLGSVHGLAAPFGGTHSAPHGAVCAALLPHALGLNLRLLRNRQPGSDTLARYDTLATLLTGSPRAVADDGLAWVHALVRDLAIPPLRSYGLAPAEFDDLATKAAAASSMKANPVMLSHVEIVELIQAAY